MVTYDDSRGIESSVYIIHPCADPVIDAHIRLELLDDLFNLLNRKRPIRVYIIGSRIIRHDPIFRPGKEQIWIVFMLS